MSTLADRVEELEHEVMAQQEELDAAQVVIDALEQERDELSCRVAALEEQLRLAGAGEFEQTGPDSYETDDGTVH